MGPKTVTVLATFWDICLTLILHFAYLDASILDTEHRNRVHKWDSSMWLNWFGEVGSRGRRKEKERERDRRRMRRGIGREGEEGKEEAEGEEEERGSGGSWREIRVMWMGFFIHKNKIWVWGLLSGQPMWLSIPVNFIRLCTQCNANQVANDNRFDYLASKNIQLSTRLSILSRL